MTTGTDAAPPPVLSRRTTWAFLAWIVVPFFTLLLALHADRDLWFDEVATVRSFVLVPPLRTLTWYPYTNNHVLSNFLNNLFLTAVGAHTWADVVARPFLLRWMPMACAAGTLAYLFALMRRGFGVRAAVLAVACLATSLPFFNFAPQIRGYSLSLLLLAMMVHHAWAFADGGAKRHAALAVVGAGLALHALPSNLYFVVAFGAAHAFLAAAGWWTRRRPPRANESRPRLLLPPGRSRDVAVAVLAACGIGLACLLYAPVLTDLVSSPIVAAHAPFRWKTLYVLCPSILLQLLSYQYVVGLVAGLALVHLATGRLALTPTRHRAIVVAVLVIVLPFVLSFVRGDWPVERSFLNAALFVAILLAVAIDAFCDWPPPAARRTVSPLVAVIVCTQASFSFGLWRAETRLERDIDEERASQDLVAQYFLGGSWRMRELTDRFAALPDAKSVPVVAWDLEWPSVRAYLDVHGIPVEYWREDRTAAFSRLLDERRSVYVFTGFPRRFEAELRDLRPDAAAERVDGERNRLTVLRVTAAAR